MRQKMPMGVSQKVPSPLVGEGQGEGADRRFTLSPPPLPSRERGGLFVADFVTNGRVVHFAVPGPQRRP